MDGRIVSVIFWITISGANVPKRNAFRNVRGSAGMAASAIASWSMNPYHQLYCGWSRENLRLGNFRYAAADGNLLSDVHTAGGLWLSAANRF